MIQANDNKKKIRLYDVSQQYDIIGKVGNGTYGTVFKAKSKSQRKNYAIKKLQINDPKLQAEGFPVTALRELEVMLLKHMNHPNIIGLRELILSKPNKANLMRGSTFLVLQYMDHDLAGLFINNAKFSLAEIKCIMKQLIEGVEYLHNKKILHRDIKPANVLLNDKGQVKLADFGLGRKFRDERNMTFKVVTLWYRAPQLMLQYKKYDYKIDIWSLGCVFAQFFIKEILFKKQNQFSQLQKILQICGDYKSNEVPKQFIDCCVGYKDMMHQYAHKSMQRKLERHIRNLCPSIQDDALDLLAGMLDLNPKTRLSCSQALKHPFFANSPLPCQKNQIVKFQYECHELLKNSSIKVDRQMLKQQIQIITYPKYKGERHHKYQRSPSKQNRISSEFKYEISKSNSSDSGSDSYQNRNFERSRLKKRSKNDEDRGNKDKYFRQNRQKDKQRQKDKAKQRQQRDSYRQKDRTRQNNKYEKQWDRNRDNKDKQRQKDRARQRERERERDRDRDRDRERQKEKDYRQNKQKQRERNKERQIQKQKDKQRQKYRDYDKYYDRDRSQKQKDRYRAKSRQKDKKYQKMRRLDRNLSPSQIKSSPNKNSFQKQRKYHKEQKQEVYFMSDEKKYEMKGHYQSQIISKYGKEKTNIDQLKQSRYRQPNRYNTEKQRQKDRDSKRYEGYEKPRQYEKSDRSIQISIGKQRFQSDDKNIKKHRSYQYDDNQKIEKGNHRSGKRYQNEERYSKNRTNQYQRRNFGNDHKYQKRNDDAKSRQDDRKNYYQNYERDIHKNKPKQFKEDNRNKEFERRQQRSRSRQKRQKGLMQY